MTMQAVDADGPFYSLNLHYTARATDPSTQDDAGEDRNFMTLADPVPDLETALRLAWYFIGRHGADYGLLYFESSQTLLDNEGQFKPRYRLNAPDGNYGSMIPLHEI